MSTLKWSEGRSLYQISNSRYNAQYIYNDEGLRITREVKEFGKSTYVEYVWGNHGLAGFTLGEDTVVVLYGQDGTPIGFSLNDTVYTYIKNLQGDVIRVLDTEGNTVVEYSYDPWGVPTITGDAALAAINPCSYRCYDYDEESGFYYLQSRYYNPQTGRFLNADVLIDTGAKVYACTGGVSYSKIWGKYYARKALVWGIIKTFYYQKIYIFWGGLVARSAIGQW